MKLSEKGESRLYGSHNVFYDDDIEGDVVALWELSKVWEFEPDDFKDCVVLTVEEAKRIMDYIDGVVFISDELQMHIEHLFKPLKDGIKQAEDNND